MEAGGSTTGFELFEAHAREVAARFEQRRIRFLRRLKWRCAAGAFLLVTFPFWFAAIASFDGAQEAGVPGPGWVIIHIVAALFLIGLILTVCVMPVFSYRTYTAQFGSSLPGVSGIMQQHVSLKAGIFGQLLRYFGDIAMHEDRQPALKSFSGAPDMPEFDDFTCEDYIKGVLDAVCVEICEAELRVGHRRQPQRTFFRGLMVILDINEMGVALRGRFDGCHVVAHGTLNPAQYPKFQRFALSGNHVTALTTDAREAESLLSPALLAALQELSVTVRSAQNQVLHSDDRLAFAINRAAQSMSDSIAGMAKGLLNLVETGRYAVQSTRSEMRLAQSPLSEAAQALGRQVHAAFWDDKVLITIPTGQNLFEPDMIFRPPLHEADIRLAWDMMTSIGRIAHAVVAARPKEMV